MKKYVDSYLPLLILVQDVRLIFDTFQKFNFLIVFYVFLLEY